MKPDATASTSRFSAASVWVMAALLALLTPNAMLTGRGSPDDRSVFAYMGWLMHRGYRPYVDVWDHKGPLLYWLNWLGWTLTPDSTVGIGVLQAFVTLGTFACLLWILRQLVSALPLILTIVFALTFLAQTGEGGNMAETWALLPIAAVHVVVFAFARRGWKRSDALILSASFAACFAIRPNLCLEPAIACLIVLHFVRLQSGFGFAFLALFTTGVLSLLGIALLVSPLWIIGAGQAFVQAYFVYNAAYSQFVTLREHVIGIFRLLSVMRTVALLYAAFLGWLLLLIPRGKNGLARSYRLFLVIVLPAEAFSAALSGRSFYHYLVPLIPVTTILCALAVEWLLHQSRAASLAFKVIVTCLVALALILQIRKYAIFLHDVLTPHQPEVAVAAFVSRVTGPDDRILPVGDVGSDTLALQSRREPASRFIYQLPLVHRANANADRDRALFIKDVEDHPPAVIFSSPGPVGNLCDASSPTQPADREEAFREGYEYDQLRTELTPFLSANYQRVSWPEFKDDCVYVRNGLSGYK